MRLHLGQRIDVLPGLVAGGSSVALLLEILLAALNVGESEQLLVLVLDDALDVGLPEIAHRQSGL